MKKENRGRKRKYHLQKMKVGDTITADVDITNIFPVIHYFRKTNPRNKFKFKCRTITNGVEIKRIK